VHQTCEILIVPATGGASRTLVRTAFTCELLSSESLDPEYRFATAFAEPVPDLIRELQTRMSKAARSASAMDGASNSGMTSKIRCHSAGRHDGITAFDMFLAPPGVIDSTVAGYRQRASVRITPIIGIGLLRGVVRNNAAACQRGIVARHASMHQRRVPDQQVALARREDQALQPALAASVLQVVFECAHVRTVAFGQHRAVFERMLRHRAVGTIPIEQGAGIH